MAQKIPTWVWIAGLAGVGYAFYKLSDAFRQGVNVVTAPVTDAIASIVGPSAQTDIRTTGAVAFPNGALVPTSSLQIYASGSDALVNYQGRTYKLSPHDANGNYPATPT